MKFQIKNGLIQGLPLALLLTVFAQGAAIVWWSSANVSDVAFVEGRVSQLEEKFSTGAKGQVSILQRLARIEERLKGQRRLLERIDKRVH